jgi:hypothetical protein
MEHHAGVGSDFRLWRAGVRSLSSTVGGLRGVERQRRRKDSDDSTGDEAGSHDRERRLAALPVEFGEPEVGVCNAERRAAEALAAMTVEDGLCLQESGRLVPTAASHYGR